MTAPATACVVARRSIPTGRGRRGAARRATSSSMSPARRSDRPAMFAGRVSTAARDGRPQRALLMQGRGDGNVRFVGLPPSRGSQGLHPRARRSPHGRPVLDTSGGRPAAVPLLKRSTVRMASHDSILIVEDDREAASYLVKAFREAGPRRRPCRRRPRRLRAWRASGDYDVLVVDRMLPQARRPVADRPPARAGDRDAGADPVGARPGRRPRQGPAGRRRRLPAEALRLLRAAGPRRGAGAPARRRQAASRPSTGSATSSSTACRTVSTAPAARSSCSRASSACSNI